MSIFVIFKVSEPAKLAPVIRQHFESEFYKLKDDEWLIAATATAREVSDRLGITNGENGSGIVFKMGSYYGRANTDIWDWIQTKSEAHRD